MKNEKILQGKLSICRTTGRDDDREVKIELIDELSGVPFVQINLSAAAFGLVATGASRQPCEFIHRPAHVGRRREHKEIPVFIPNGRDVTKVRQAVAEHEVDGWIGSDTSAMNHYNRTAAQKAAVDGETRMVTYERWVEAEKTT